jgi:RND family efflux transporter MFP subunit
MARAQLEEALALTKQTSAQKEQAELEVDRFSKMRDQEVVSELEAARKQSEAQTLDAEAEGDRAKVAQGTEPVRRHRIVAPFDGTVVARNVDPGDWLNAGEVALQLLTAQHVEVEVRVPGRMLDRLPDVAQVVIEDDARRSSAQIASAVQALDPRTRTALLRLTPTEEAPWLRVGASVTAHFSVERTDGTTIPRDALVYGIAGTRVYVDQNGKALPIDVELLATSSTDVLVKSGALKLGMRLVTKGNERLRPGQDITEQDALVPAAKEP